MFSSEAARIDNAMSQQNPRSPIELRRMEFEAVDRLAEAFGNKVDSPLPTGFVSLLAVVNRLIVFARTSDRFVYPAGSLEQLIDAFSEATSVSTSVSPLPTCSFQKGIGDPPPVDREYLVEYADGKFEVVCWTLFIEDGWGWQKQRVDYEETPNGKRRKIHPVVGWWLLTPTQEAAGG